MKKQRRFGIGFKITSGYALLIFCLVVSVLLLNNQITNLQHERNAVIKYDSNMRILSNGLERQVINMESSLNRFLMTNDPNYLDKYYEEIETWEVRYEELEELVSDFSNDEEQLIPIYADIVSWINTFGKPLNEAIISADPNQIRAAYNAEYSSVAIKTLQERLSNHFRTNNNKNMYIHQAMMKYGKENFKIELIAQVPDEE